MITFKLLLVNVPNVIPYTVSLYVKGWGNVLQLHNTIPYYPISPQYTIIIIYIKHNTMIGESIGENGKKRGMQGKNTNTHEKSP